MKMNKKNPKSNTRPGLDGAIRKVDELVEVLDQLCRQAELHDSQGHAELLSALETAKETRQELSKRDISDAKWKRVTWTLEYLLSVAKQLCTFINCRFPSKRFNEYWVDYKAIA